MLNLKNQREKNCINTLPINLLTLSDHLRLDKIHNFTVMLRMTLI